MKIVCSKCGFEGSINDKLIPDGGKNVTCPKCKSKFLVKKEENIVTEEEIIASEEENIAHEVENVAHTIENMESKKTHAKMFGFKWEQVIAILLALILIMLMIQQYSIVKITNSITKIMNKPEPIYEYRIESIDDKYFTREINLLGVNGWKLVFARRALDVIDRPLYECIFIREKVIGKEND